MEKVDEQCILILLFNVGLMKKENVYEKVCIFFFLLMMLSKKKAFA